MVRWMLLFTFTFSFNAGAKTLMVGDSHTCGTFGNFIAKEIASSDSLVIYCSVSSSAYNWLYGTTPSGQRCFRMESPGFQKKACGADGKIVKLESVLAKEKPSSVVMALGTNSLGSSVAGLENAAIAKILANYNCRWIGPPHLNPPQARGFDSKNLSRMNYNLDQYYRSLSEQISAHCRLIDSRPWTKPGQAGFITTDGVHRGGDGGKAWAIGVLPSLSSRLAPLAPATFGRN